MAELAGVFSFGDWILALTHLMFYLERRRALVWDPSAQRQILRFLLLSPEISRNWSQAERDILTMDSNHRNLRAAVSSGEKDLSASEEAIRAAPAIRNELRSLERIQEADIEERDRLDTELAEAEGLRDEARLRRLTLEQRRESIYREVERSELRAVESRFPTRSESARSIIAQLLTSSECLACGSLVPETALDLHSRIVSQGYP